MPLTPEQLAKRKSTNKKIWLTVLPILLILFLIGKFVPKDEPVQTALTKPTEKPLVEFYDIPSILGESIEAVKKDLGKPKEERKEPDKKTKKLLNNIWSIYYEKNGNPILIDYDTESRTVAKVFIAAPDSENGSTTDWEYLVKLGKLDSKSTAYTIEPVKSFNQPGKFTGIKVIPN